MRAVVVMSRPQVGAAEVDSPAAALRELGCEVVAVGYDLDDLPDDLEHIRPAVVVVDAGPYLEVGRAVVKHAKQIPTLAEVPILLCIEVSRLPGLDPELGMDDFILSPIVGPELYARVRQLDWRLSSFSASGRIKLGPAEFAAALRLARQADEAVVVSFGSPFVLADFPGQPGLCAFSHIAAAQRAAARALLGRIPVMGRMPVEL